MHQRHTPGEGTIDLDPDGAYSSEAFAVNQRGDVYGLSYLRREPPLVDPGHFLYRGGQTFDRLEKNAPRDLERRFSLHDLNRRGDLVGQVQDAASWSPYLYTWEDGWVDLTGLDPSFAGRPVAALAINARGEILIEHFLSPGRQFFLLAGDDLVELRGFPTDLNDQGLVVGGELKPAGDGTSALHAYVRLGRRTADIHPGPYSWSIARKVTEKGVVAGEAATEGSVYDALFIWDRRRERKLRIEARSTDFSALLPAGFDLEEMRLIQFNDRLEAIGTVEGRRVVDGTFELTKIFFYFSPAVGVVDLNTATSGPGIVREVTDSNAWGEILVRFNEGSGGERRPAGLIPSH